MGAISGIHIEVLIWLTTAAIVHAAVLHVVMKQYCSGKQEHDDGITSFSGILGHGARGLR